MQNIFLVFDETEINKKIYILWCIVFEEDSFFSDLKKILNDIKFLNQFWKLRKEFPHYTNDSLSQRQIIAKEFWMMNFRVYFNIKQFSKNNLELSEIYKSNLLDLIKPILRKYDDIYWNENINYKFFFEQLSNYDIEFFKNLINWICSINVDIKMISKKDYNWVTSVIDYCCWIIRELLINKGEKETSFWITIFKTIINKVSLVRIDLLNNREVFYHLTSDEKRKKFIKENNWKFKLDIY